MKTKLAIVAALLVVGLAADAHAQSWGLHQRIGMQTPRVYGEPCWSIGVTKCSWEAKRAALRASNGNGKRR